MILDMAEDAHTQIILGRPFLATVSCKIDVKKGRLTFDIGEKYAEFGLFKNFESSPSTYSCCGCDVIGIDEPVHFTKMAQNDSSSLNCALFKG